MCAKKSDRLAAKREEILSAAVEVFAREGYETTSMDRIAEQAGASKRTVYNHFASKEELFFETVARLVDCDIAALQVTWDAERPMEEQLAEFARFKGGLLRDESTMALMRVVVGLAIRDPSLLEGFEHRYGKSEKMLTEWLRAADAAGALRVPDVELAATVFWGMAGGALFWPAALGHGPGPERVEAIVQEIVTMFLARYRPA